MARLAGYRHRIPITVIDDAGGASRNVRVTVPTGLDELWNVIDSNGYGVRITEADGETLLNHNRQSFTEATRTMVLDFESATMPNVADRAALFWLYFAPTGTPAEASTSVAVTSQLTGRVELGLPGHHVVSVRPPTPTKTEPADRIQKTVDDVAHLWLDFSAVLERSSRTYQGRREYEEPWHGAYQVLNSGGTAVPAMIDAAAMRWVTYRSGGQGAERVALRVLVQSGTNGDSFTVEAVMATAAPGVTGQARRLAHRVGLDTTNLLLS